MSTLNYLTSGLVQLNTPSSTINGISSAVQNATNNGTSTAQPDCNIYPVGNTINPVDTIYHEQTVLMVNSTINQNANTVTASYFDPVGGNGSNTPLNNWNFDYGSNSFLNGTMSSSCILGDDLSLYSNMQPVSNASGKHNIDITNGSTTSPTNYLFFSLTPQPYYTINGSISQWYSKALAQLRFTKMALPLPPERPLCQTM